MSDPAIKTSQFDHQLEDYLAHRDDLFYALFWEMGLGKTKEIIDVASHLFLASKIDGVLIVAPNAVYSNWTLEELPAHMAVPYVKLLFNSGSKGDRAKMRRALFLAPSEWRGRLRVMCMSYDGIRTEHGFQLAEDFTILHRVMIVADESTAIKNPKTENAKRMKKIRSRCHYAWIATGTPIADKPFDIHSQIEFLAPDFWKRHGMRTRDAFKTQFGIFQQKRAGLRVWNECVGYQNLERLQTLIRSISSRRLKEDSTIKLPPKIYKTIMFELSDKQRRAYDELRKQYLTELENGVVVEAPLAIVRLTRLQQIASGFVTVDVADPQNEMFDAELRGDPITQNDYTGSNDEPAQYDLEQWRALQTAEPDPHEDTWATRQIEPVVTTRQLVDVVEPEDNPRLKLLVELVEQAAHKVIVWCRFTRDVDNVCAALGEIAVRYDGKTGREERAQNLARFKNPVDSARVFVANVHAISQGVTLVIAKTVIYYTNSFSPEKRLQSEDRPHRIGQTSSVLYVDLVAADTVDERLINGLRNKYEISARVMGDAYREWLQPIKREED